MDLFFNFVLQAVSYFITTYFVYSIFGRKKKIAYILLGIIFMSTLYPFLQYGSTLETRALILLVVYEVGPVVFAFLIFTSITGGLPGIKFKKRQFTKKSPYKPQPKYANLLTSYLVMGTSLIALASAYFILEDVTMYLIMGLSAISFVLGILLFIKTNKIVQERVILCVGKQKEYLYTYDLPKNGRTIDVKDFFDDDRYIIDFIGEVILTNTEQKIEKDFLYWLATSERVTVQKPLYPISKLSYQSDLELFEKYHVKRISYQMLKTGSLEKTSEKIMK